MTFPLEGTITGRVATELRALSIMSPEASSPFEALSQAFGVSGEAARVLVGIGGVMNDPVAEATVRRIQTDRARGAGASVLADQPY